MKEISVLKLFEFSKRRGKKFVINDIVKESSGEILVFCDSNSLFEKDAIKNLVKYFIDQKVGGVCGRLKLLDVAKRNKTHHQEKKYWDYETWIKSSEGSLGVLIGSNGAIYSIRRELFISMPEKEPVVDDLYLSLKVLEQGKDFLFSTESQAMEYLATSDLDEFKRKIRILPRSLETLKKTKSLLFKKRILISYCYWSHKVIRWFSPLLLIILLISNLLIIGTSNFYSAIGTLQVIFYSSGLIGFILNKMDIKIYYFELIYYFILTNVALIIGYQKFLFKKHRPYWEPTTRV
jgi:cellulose synthase/poly-beta-1,6-N-acetylglucosamine synthase-like glycosyltransferase